MAATLTVMRTGQLAGQGVWCPGQGRGPAHKDAQRGKCPRASLQGQPPAPPLPPAPLLCPSAPQPPPRGAAALSDPGLALPAGQGHALRGEYGMQGGGAGPLLLVSLQWPRLFCPDASARVCPPSVRDPGSVPTLPLGRWGPVCTVPALLPSQQRGASEDVPTQAWGQECTGQAHSSVPWLQATMTV